MNNEYEIKPNEAALVQTKRARAAAMQAGANALAKARQTADNIGELQVLCVNRLIEAGKHFNVGCGREQLLFTSEGFEFARREIVPHLAAGLTLEHVKAAVRLANHHPEPLRTVAELREVKKELQQVMVVFHLAENGPRPPQLASGRNLFADIVDYFTSGISRFKKLESEVPIEAMSREQLEDLLKAAEPVDSLITRAKKRLLGV